MELVLDASVVIKWFLPEEKSPEVQELRRAHLSGEIFIMAPALLLFEIVNALVYKKELTGKVIDEAIKVFFFTNPQLVEFTQEVTSSTAKIARKHEISVYDASYVALAKVLACQFITADEKLFKKIKSLKFVKLLE